VSTGRRLEPDLFATKLPALSLDELAARGVEAILLDLDNTLCTWGSERFGPGCAEWVAAARERFRVCIVSNSIRPRRMNRVAEALGIPAVGRWLLGRKPFAGGIQAALKQVGVPAAKAVMVGDQLFTDVLGGNRLGLLTVWVKPLPYKEFAGTRVSRWVESFLERRFRRQGRLPEGW
jgi:uncharacterized protein